MIFLFTASVTLSAIVCPFINYVCSNPQVLATLSAEIDSFESKKEISSPIASYRESSRMPYLMACIEETLRLAPPTPVALTRKIGTGGTMLNGVFIPEGVEIGANPYVINRDPGLFGADAHLFRPERWLQDASCTRHMSKHIFTWGFGVRDCAGKAMARLMLQKLCLQVRLPPLALIPHPPLFPFLPSILPSFSLAFIHSSRGPFQTKDCIHDRPRQR